MGLGPGDMDWMTPQSRRELACATDLIGYHTYLNRIPVRDGQRRHPSDNTDEPARARLACSLAEQGQAVAVVSSGDPGVFAMATAVLEEAKQWPDVQIRVIPAMTAAQAVASRVGAPLGHDYAVISLSDRLKPWDVIAARLTAAAAADLVLAIYNPPQRRASGRSARCGTCCSNIASRARRWWSAATCRALRKMFGWCDWLT
ncbi:tetrapyrrole (Corrin/Porphyrin) Methylases family protein [Mycobacterium kansasii]|uniref:Tetrapyrrole (Corrin/Porphyrin) Methylases family protein n=1 Tax=Mycobacterium kansasii TaxID=1768 RepID=A0A1V3WCW5_MYCKA|nr:tetrapyrrole (Corrin/Porphyrin) Methylases family protein [Mycobacterium kansasii]